VPHLLPGRALPFHIPPITDTPASALVKYLLRTPQLSSPLAYAKARDSSRILVEKKKKNKTKQNNSCTSAPYYSQITEKLFPLRRNLKISHSLPGY
jgi:hypothetical protein